MRAIPPNRQKGVALHVFSHPEQLARVRTPPNRGIRESPGLDSSGQRFCEAPKAATGPPTGRLLVPSELPLVEVHYRACMNIAVHSFLRQHKDEILRAWETRVTSEHHEVELVGLALRNDIPTLLDALADWLKGDEPPERLLVAAEALKHVMQRLDAGLSLAQVFREYRALREAIIEASSKLKPPSRSAPARPANRAAPSASKPWHA